MTHDPDDTDYPRARPLTRVELRAAYAHVPDVEHCMQPETKHEPQEERD